ncbi:MAG: RloB domain-containing protein [Desulfobacteraceae bacterium]|nr:RloB domain-containing protein [Desulfobacteraceae bacterium]
MDPEKLEIIIVGKGQNTDSLVEEAIKLKEEAKRENKPYNQVWCVFDRDSFPSQNFNRAIQLARSKKIRCAYSNEAFEIWYLLHFEYFINAMSRTQYQDKLEPLLGHKYKKNSKTMYTELLDKQQNAIRNSKKLLLEYEHDNPAENNPSTKVFKLVEELNERLKK